MPGTESIASGLYALFSGFMPTWLSYLLAGLVIMVVIANAVLVYTMFFIWMERRIIARFQVRFGPNRVGPAGLLQPIADAIKIITKEDIVPANVDKWVYNLAPIVFFIPTMVVFSVIPFGKGLYLTNVNIGILFIIGVTTVSVFGIFMAGWSSNNKFALFGAMRAVAVLVSYEIPMVLSVVGVLIITGSLALGDIVEKQTIPFILYQPLGFLVFLLAASAELGRTPFDVLEADSEIVAGYHTEYSGMKFGLFQLTEWAAALASSCIITTLFLGGWKGPLSPPIPPILWFLFKATSVFFFFLWTRSTLPRLRIDQIMAFAWKYLLPLSLVNVFLTALEALYFPDFPPFLVAVSLVASVATYLVLAKVFRFEWGKRQLLGRAPIVGVVSKFPEGEVQRG